MKNYLASLLPLIFALTSFGNVHPEMDEQVVRSFNTLFPEVKDARWSETSDSYVVHFTDAGIRSRIVYVKESPAFLYTRYYMADNLPAALRMKLKKNFPGKQITGVTEISKFHLKGKEMQMDYYMNLEDDHWLLNLRVRDNGRTKVQKRYIRQQQDTNAGLLSAL